MSSFRVAALSGAAIVLSGASFAGAPAMSRYSVVELAEPEPADCLEGYATRALSTGLNDQGVASLNFRCTRNVATEPFPLVDNAYVAYTATAHGGAVSLTMPAGEEASGFTVSLDGQRVYGQSTASQRALIWPLAGGFEDAFQPFPLADCGRLEYANSGNENGYVVGWQFRPDPSMPPPLDTFCLAVGWVVRTPTGQFYGPVNGVAIDVNRSNVAVGTAGHAGIMMHLPSRREIVLNAGDATHAVMPSDINDRGEVVGYIDEVAEGAQIGCGPSNPVFWQRSGAQIALAKLPGAPSARPWSSVRDGIVVGESGSGQYCDPSAIGNQRAVIWHGTRITDLNTLIPASEDITLAYAAEINASGQILMTGYRNGEPPLPCPDWVQGESGFAIDFTLTCRTLRNYLLTPQP